MPNDPIVQAIRAGGTGVAVADDEDDPILAALRAPSSNQPPSASDKIGTPDVVAAYATRNGVPIGAARRALRDQGYELRDFLPGENPQYLLKSSLPPSTPFSASIPRTPPTAAGAAAGGPMINLAPPQTPQTFDASQIPRSPFTNKFEGINPTPDQVRAQNTSEDAKSASDLQERQQDAAFGLTPEQVTEHDQGVDKMNEKVESLARKVPVPAFVDHPSGTNPYPFGIRASNVGELTDLANEYLNDPRQPKTQLQAFAAGTAADTVKMMLSPINLLSAGMGGIEAGALSKAGDLATDAVKLAQDYDAMRQAGASGAELAEMEGKMSKAVDAAAKAQKALILAKKAGAGAAVGFGAQGAGNVVQGIADKSLPEIAGGVGQTILGGAAAHGTAGGDIEDQVKGATRERVQENLKGQEVSAKRTGQVPAEAQQSSAASWLGDGGPTINAEGEHVSPSWEKEGGQIRTIGAREALMPEKPETLAAQVDALDKGTNKIVYFPKGQGSLPEPPENVSVTVVPGEKPGAGTYYHDESITPQQIKGAVDDGSYGKLLGYTSSKETAMQGKPAGVVARDENGTEIKAGLVDASDPQAVAEQAAEFARQFPEAKIGVETPEHVLRSRQASTHQPETSIAETGESAQTQASQTEPQPSSDAIVDAIRGTAAPSLTPHARIMQAMDVQQLRENAESIKTRFAAGERIPLEEITHLHELADRVESHAETAKRESLEPGTQPQKTVPRRTRKITNDAIVAEAYRPGNVVRSYVGHDKVLEFTPGDESKPYPHNSWHVRVIASDEKGNPLPGERERLHQTPPEKNESMAARKRLEARAPLVASPGDRVQITSGKLKGQNGEVTRATDEGGVYVRTPDGTRAQYVKSGDFEHAKSEEKAAERPQLSSTTAYSNPLFDPELWKGVLGYLKPSEAAGNANLRERTGGLARAQAVLQEKLRAEHNRWRGRSDSDMLAFADLVENGEADRAARGVTLKPETQKMLDAGKKRLNTQDKNLAATLRTLLDEGRTAVQNLGTGKLQNFIENYFPHMWEQKGSKVGQAIGQVFGKKPLEGPKSFLKQRTIPTTAEGFDKDLKPATSNPVDLAVLKMHEMNRYVMAHRLLDDLKAAGSAKFVGFGQKAPDGWRPLDDKVFQVLQWSEAEQGMILRGRYYAPEAIAQPINRYVGSGLRGVPIYDILRSFGNSLNQLQLGLSGFHLGTTSLNAVISQFALAAKKLAHGQVLSAAKNLITAPAAPIRNLIQGGQVLSDYLRPDQAKKYAETAKAVERAGGRSGMGEEYIDNRIERMMQSFANKKWFKGALQAIPAAVEAQAIPVLKWVVPRMKLGAFHDLAADILERARKNNWSQDRVRTELQKSWDSIDNRFGQVVYDNLNWNKVAKDLAFIGVRSVGWNYGTWRELGGGVKDFASQVGRSLNGKGFDVTDRMAYTFALPLTIAALGALYMLAHTGKWPQSAKDYFYPKNGKIEDDGTEARSSLPSYMKDVFAMSEHPVDTAMHKVNPAIGLITEMLENKDYYGNEIRNADDPAMAQLWQAVEHVGESFLPFTVRNAQKRAQIGQKGIESQVENFLGITPAPRSVERSDAEALAHDLLERRAPAGAHTASEQKKQQQIFDLENQIRSGTLTREALKRRLDSGAITEQEAFTAFQRARTPGLVRAFKQLSIPEALKVWDVASDEERDELKPLFETKVQNGFQKLTREDMDLYRPLLRRALAWQPGQQPTRPGPQGRSSTIPLVPPSRKTGVPFRPPGGTAAPQ